MNTGLNDESISKVLKIYNSYKNLKIEGPFDILINETPLYDPINFYNFKKIFGTSKRIDVLHGNAMRAVKNKRPPLLKFPLFGSLNTRIDSKLKYNGWDSAYFPRTRWFLYRHKSFV